jgi:hypothetical protein
VIEEKRAFTAALLQRKDNPTRYRIGHTQTAAEVFKRVTE